MELTSKFDNIFYVCFMIINRNMIQSSLDVTTMYVLCMFNLLSH